MEKRVLYFGSPMETRENDGENPIIEAYFAVFDENYQLWDGFFERISPSAFNKSLDGKADVRALTNHDSTKVLGRTTAGTLTLNADDHGLFGRVSINPKDSDAMNLYERVKRGDVSQCSFGFTIDKMSEEFRNDGSVLRTIEDLTLFEVSICTFPAYESTEAEARSCLETRKAALSSELQRIESQLEKREISDETPAESEPEAKPEAEAETPDLTDWRAGLLERLNH